MKYLCFLYKIFFRYLIQLLKELIEFPSIQFNKMENLFLDECQIKELSQIQKNLCSLDPNSDEKQLDELISQIPLKYLTQKEELMCTCKIFAMYSRSTVKTTKSNSIKLFEKILKYIKEYLSDESSFFWNIFGGLYYFKLWMHEEGIISIETIIQNCINISLIEYFLPEIMKEAPEIYEKDIKYRLKQLPSQTEISELIETRKKFFIFLRDSKSYHDTFYEEIEKDQLRLAIKRDDIDSFQRILSNTNLPINSKIKDNVTENFHRFSNEVTLIQYAIEFNATKICHFLIMQDAEINETMIWSSIFSGNYEVIHFLENKINSKFQLYSLCNSISCWSDELIEYSLSNFDIYDFFTKENLEELDDISLLFNIMRETFYYFNFVFFETTLLPFLRKNEILVSKNINEIVFTTFSETTGFFLRGFIKSPNVDINYFSSKLNRSFFGSAIEERNTKAIEILLENNEIDINAKAFNDFSPLCFAIAIRSDMKIIDLLCKNNADMNLRDTRYGLCVFDIAISRNNFYAINFLINHPNYQQNSNFNDLFLFCLREKYFYTFKLILKYFIDTNKDASLDELTIIIETVFSHLKETCDEFKKICDEIKNS